MQNLDLVAICFSSINELEQVDRLDSFPHETAVEELRAWKRREVEVEGYTRD